MALLHQAEAPDARDRKPAKALPSGTGDDAPSPRAFFEAAMETLRDVDATVFDARREELAYLTNVLLAGTADRELRPIEALELALEHCGRGLQRELGRKTSPAAVVQALLRLPADMLFRLGWAPRQNWP